MVKINKTLSLALLAALAASCSSDNDVAQAPETVNGNSGTAYATLRIDLPTQHGSRAVTFDDGDNFDEYKVNDATLLVFKKAGSSEGEYTFVESVPLGDMTPWTADGNNGITTTADVTVKLTTTSLADLKAGNCYGLVILNNKAYNGTDKITIPTEGTKYSAWNDPKYVNAEAMQDTHNGIVMANAPEWKTSGQVPTTLVQIDGGHVKTTETLAKGAGPAAEIHVERGLAKVTLKKPTDESVTGGNPQYEGDKVTLNAWTLDVTNKSSFPVHNIEGLATDYADIWNYSNSTSTPAPTTDRFQDHTNTFKRVYWGIDPNYSTDLTTLDKCKEAFDITDDPTWASTGDDTPFDDDDSQYCLENTFDIDHMQQGQTTRVLIKATYKKGGSEAKTFYKFGSSSKLYDETDLIDALKERYYNLNGDVEEVDVKLKADGSDITTAGVHDLQAANFEVKKYYSFSPAKPSTRGQGSDQSEHPDPVVPTEKITTYQNGICYYIGRIKHFGDDETPWNTDDPTYDKNNLKWLGRYGVLRNNWYSLNVLAVHGPGEPTVPTINPTDPDDDKYNYIDLGVKILQWAKRTQNLQF